jgi:hypothetical protein
LLQTIANGGTATAPAVTRSNYRFNGWDKPLSNIIASQTITAQWTYNGNTSSDDGDSGSSDSGGSSGGGSSGGGSSSPTTTTTTTSNTPTTVTTAAANSAVSTAIAAAQASGGETATARLTNPGDITLAALQSMAQQAGDTPLKVNADSMNGNAVDVRITIDPSQATVALNLSASTVNAAATNVNNIFDRFFTNDVMTVALGQESNFGMPVQIAAKLDPALNTENLVFYAYNRAANSYTRIAATDYWIDANGYVHFSTTLGGNIIISDGALTRG